MTTDATARALLDRFAIENRQDDALSDEAARWIHAALAQTALRDRIRVLEAALRDAIAVIDGLAEQQAIPDDSYRFTRERLAALTPRQEPTP